MRGRSQSQLARSASHREVHHGHVLRRSHAHHVHMCGSRQNFTQFEYMGQCGGSDWRHEAPRGASTWGGGARGQGEINAVACGGVIEAQACPGRHAYVCIYM